VFEKYRSIIHVFAAAEVFTLFNSLNYALNIIRPTTVCSVVDKYKCMIDYEHD